MSDPLSISASAAGLLNLAITVTKGLYDYCQSIKDESLATAKLGSETADLTAALQCIQHTLNERQKFRSEDSSLVKKIEASITSCQDAIKDLQSTLDRIAPSRAPASIGFKSSFRKLRRRMVYPLKEDTVQKLEKSIRRVRQNITLALETLQISDTYQIRNDLVHATDILARLRRSQMSGELIQWLNAVDSIIDHDDALEQRHPTTGLWFVEGSNYKDWLAQRHSTLWLKGFAGCGKTVLCSTATQHTIDNRTPNVRTAIAFFYFKFDNSLKQNLTALLRVLVLQLSEQCDNDYKDLKLLKEKTPTNASPSRQELEQLFWALARQFDDTYIFIDAIDENSAFPARGEVLRFLKRVSDRREDCLHVLVTSREERDIGEVLYQSYTDVPMKNDGVEKDIAKFIREQLNSNVSLRKWSSQHSLIEKALISKANGVFRWVQCQFREIAECPVIPAVLKELLDSLPRDLDKTYERMLGKIPPYLTQYARRILIFLCFSQRPLTVEEMVDATAVDREKGFDPEMRCADTQDILQVCQGLVDVFEDAHNFLHAVKVRIAHFSVQQYLFSKQLEGHPTLSYMHLEEELVHTEIVKVCLRYLLHEEVSISKQSKIFQPEYPFVGYAADHWIDHFNSVPDRSKSDVLDLAVRLFSSPNAFGNMIEIAGCNPRTLWKSKNKEEFHAVEMITSQLPYIARWHLNDLLTRLLAIPGIRDEKGRALDSFDNLIDALYQAMQWHNVYAVQALVEHLQALQLPENFWDRIDFARGWSTEGNAFTALLLEAGAPLAEFDFWLKNKDRITTGPNPESLDLLLRQGLFFEGEVDDLSPLILAVSWQDAGSLESLIDCGYDVNTQTLKSKRTPLGEAINSGSLEMVKTLLARGADPNNAANSTPINSKDAGKVNQIRTHHPLTMAIRLGHSEIAEALLESDASSVDLIQNVSMMADPYIWSVDGLGRLLFNLGAPIGHREVQAAILAESRFPGIARFTLQHARNSENGLQLEAHSALGNLGEVQKLVEAGVATSSGLAFFFATAHGHIDIMSLLNSKGAVLDADQFDALFVERDEITELDDPKALVPLDSNDLKRRKAPAIKMRNEKETRKWLDSHATDCLDLPNFGAPQLYLACRYGLGNIARLLMCEGADANQTTQSKSAMPRKFYENFAKDDKPWEMTALGGAIISGDFNLVKLIMEDYGGNIYACSSDEDYCILQVVASTNDTEMLNYLLIKGAKELVVPDREPIKYWPGADLSRALYTAILTDADGCVRVLLERTKAVMNLKQLNNYLQDAASCGSSRAVQALLEAGATVTEDILISCQGTPDLLRVLLSRYDQEGRADVRWSYSAPEDLHLPIQALVPL